MAATNTQQLQVATEVRIIRRKQVESKTGLPRSTLYAKIASGDFPRQIQLGPKAVGWLESEVNQWLTNQIEGSRKPVLAG